jgi:hypothetical protein
MDFNQLLAKMRDLDQPTTQSMPATEACGDAPMPMSMPPSMNDQAPPAHPSMSVNLNAQGMDSIESLLKLMTKVNPDMINQPMPAMSIEPIGMPSLTPPGPSISSIGDLGDLDKGPLKMLPDLDKGEPHSEPDADNMGGPSDMDADNMPPMGIQKAMGDRDGDGDHDMKDHDLEKKDDSDEEGEEEADDEEDKKEAWANEPEENYKSVDYMNNQLAGGMNKPKQMHKHSYRQGDNPMTMPEGDLRASIRAELQQRLAEAKGAK